MVLPDRQRRLLEWMGKLFLEGPEAMETPPDGLPLSESMDTLLRLGLAAAPTGPAGLVSEEQRTLWRSVFMDHFARRAALAAQVQELSAACEREGLEVILLKGAAAARFYPSHLLRTSGDLDLLVRDQDVAAIQQLLTHLGFRPVADHGYGLDEELAARTHHLRPYFREGRLKVEVHLRFLHGRGDGDAAAGHAWRDAVPVPGFGTRTRMLSPEHFILHAAVNYAHDLRTAGPGLKTLIDIALLVRQRGQEIDWEALWRAAELWQVSDDAALVFVTLNAHWGLDIPLPHHAPAPIPAAVVLLEERWKDENPDTEKARSYAWRVSAVQGIPGWRGRVRYLLRLAFPAPQRLRRMCQVPEGRSVAPYYLLYPLSRLTRLAGAFWRSRSSRPCSEVIGLAGATR